YLNGNPSSASPTVVPDFSGFPHRSTRWFTRWRQHEYLQNPAVARVQRSYDRIRRRSAGVRRDGGDDACGDSERGASPHGGDEVLGNAAESRFQKKNTAIGTPKARKFRHFAGRSRSSGLPQRSQTDRFSG